MRLVNLYLIVLVDKMPWIVRQIELFEADAIIIKMLQRANVDVADLIVV